MASELKVDKFTGVTTAGSILVTGEGNSTTTNLQQGLAKAWGNLDGTGTIAIRDSFNIGSATDGGTGYYTFNYTNDMSNDDYSASENVADPILKESLIAIVPVPSKFPHAFANPCCRLVVVLLPSPVTSIEPAVDTPVNLSTLSSLAIMLSLRALK